MIWRNAFGGRNHLQNVVCYAVLPPEYEPSPIHSFFDEFDEFLPEELKPRLYVPDGSLGLYRNDEEWNKYFNCLPLSDMITGTVLPE